MGLFSTIAKSISAQQANAGFPSSNGLLPPLGSIPNASGGMISMGSAMSVSTVYACVKRRATDVARCTPSLYRLKDDGSEEKVIDHPVSKLFVRPNDIQTWFEWMEQMEAALLLRANAYAAIVRDRNGVPVKLIPINPDAVQILETQNGEIFYQVSRFGLYQMDALRGFSHAIPAEDMLHVRGISFNMLSGASTIALARDSIGLAMAQEQQSSRFVSNGARPSGVLSSPRTLSDEAAKRLKDQWASFTQGILNTGNTAVLEEGMEWKQVQLTSVDLEFVKARDWQALDVCRWFAMPPHKVGLVAASPTNQVQADQDYVNNTIMQDLDRWEQKLRRVFDLDEEDIYVDLDEEVLLRSDIITRRNASRMGILSGEITPNEARRSERRPPKPGGDNLMVPSNTAALGSEASGEASDGAGRPAGGAAPAPAAGTGGKQPTAED
jgi:HK97 family phage portal protein